MPEVIEFGVAKAIEFDLTDQSFGDTGAIVGTPTYMSPEQADPSSMDIDTREVYALGVIFYELLVGSPPIDPSQFRRGAVIEMLRMFREVDPPRPSTKLKLGRRRDDRREPQRRPLPGSAVRCARTVSRNLLDRFAFSPAGSAGADGGIARTQYESELITSPLPIEPSPTQVIGAIEFLMKRTEPSPNKVLTPPGCRLREPVNSPPCCP